MALSRNSIGMVALPIGAIAVIVARFGFDLMPGTPPLHLRDFGPGLQDLLVATVVFAAITLAAFVVERVSATEGLVRALLAVRFASLGATFASLLTVLFWLFAFSIGLLCDAGPDC